MIALDFRLEQGTFVLEARERLDGRVTVLFGPSGSGKTTILDAIAGLRQPTRGSIVLNGRQLFDSAENINLPPHKRHVGYVSQDIALFPHLGSSTEVTRAAMDQLVVDNILAWAAGKPPLTPVSETPWPPKRS